MLCRDHVRKTTSTPVRTARGALNCGTYVRPHARTYARTYASMFPPIRQLTARVLQRESMERCAGRNPLERSSVSELKEVICRPVREFRIVPEQREKRVQYMYQDRKHCVQYMTRDPVDALVLDSACDSLPSIGSQPPRGQRLAAFAHGRTWTQNMGRSVEFHRSGEKTKEKD